MNREMFYACKQLYLTKCCKLYYLFSGYEKFIVSKMLLEVIMKIWNDDEVKFLFSKVEECKKRKEGIKKAFVLHAQRYARKPNSVRNYYYMEVDNLVKDGCRQKRLGINLEMHKKNHFKTFEKGDCESLVKEIEMLRKNGYSVRAACQKLAQGDLSKMTRLQNKYQNIKKKSIKNAKNIVIFQKKEKIINENDLNSLVMGVVKLIKKTAIENFIEEEKNEKEKVEEKLRESEEKLNKKNLEIEGLKQEYEKIKNENLLLKASLQTSSRKLGKLKMKIGNKKVQEFSKVE